MKGFLFISHQTTKYTYLQSIELALRGGCRQIQLRIKDSTEEEVYKIAVEAKIICEMYNADLYIDDYVSVCKKIGAKGVHLGKTDMPPSDARKILGADFVIGGTANTVDDIRYLYNQEVDYIGLGPFRYTTTKKNLSPILGLEGYKQIVEQCKKNGIYLSIVAIGGITQQDIPELLQAGVSSIALSSTILNADNPVEETNRIINLINQYQQ